MEHAPWFCERHPATLSGDSPDLLPRLLLRRIERLESRLRLLEEESRTGIDLTKFYGKDIVPPPDDLAAGGGL